MPKYETTLKLKSREKIPDLRTILEHLFYRKPELSEKAEKIVYKLIKEKRIPDTEWKELQKEIGTTHQEYYTIISKLRAVGMITKKEGEWIMSEKFSNRCEEMAEIWKSFIKRWKEGKNA